MKDILLQHGGYYVTSEVEGRKLTLTHDDEPKYHEVYTLRSSSSYDALKQELNDIYEECGRTLEAYNNALMELQMEDFHNKYFTDAAGFCYFDLRDREAIEEYCREANDKVWLMRCCCIPSRTPGCETGRPAMERILRKYRDIPKDGYTDWECGYWNGIMGALRWVLGDEKDFLDT